MRSILVCVCVLAVFVVAEEAEPTKMDPFFQAVQSLPELVIQQEFQRRWADIFLGLTQAHHWQQYAMTEMQKYKANQEAVSYDEAEADDDVSVLPIAGAAQVVTIAGDEDLPDEEPIMEQYDEENDDDDDPISARASSFLELKEEFVGSPFAAGGAAGYGAAGYGAGLGAFGGFGFPGMYGGFGAGAAGAQQSSSVPELELASTREKISALKYMQIQLYLASGDVEKSYWMNKMLATAVPPQLMYFKLYKQYLTTMALSTAYQLHDALTFESQIDAFNDGFAYYSPRGASQRSEAMAELSSYSKWHTLAMLKFQLFYINMYERAIMTQPAQQAVNNAFNSASSFMETESELKSEPSKPFVGQDGNGLMMQYAFLSYYTMILRYYIMFSELSLTSTGLMASQMKLRSVEMFNDNDSENDAEAAKLDEQADQLEGQVLPSLFMQWSSMTQQKFFLEYYTLFLDMYMPQMAAMRAAERMENSLQEMNLVQTDAPETTTTPSQ